MRITVCMKQVPDHEASPDCFVIDAASNTVSPRGISPVLSLYDENALEAALKIKGEREEPTEIIVLTLGKKNSKAVMMKALAAGADSVIQIEDDVFESGTLDVFNTASALSAAINKIGNIDLILTGRQASDWNSGQVGIFLAEILNIPCVTLAMKINIKADKVYVKRVINNGYEVVSSPFPLVVVVSNEAGELRYPTIIGRREAKNKPIISWGSEDIVFEPDNMGSAELTGLDAVEIPKRECEFINARTMEEAAKKLAKKLEGANLFRR